jgi:type 1 glutamine amidotransferase
MEPAGGAGRRQNVKLGRMFFAGAVVLAMTGVTGTSAQAPAPQPHEGSASREHGSKKRLLCIGASKGFQHDSISYAMGTLWELGNQTGLWETWVRTDTQLITKKKLGDNAKNLDYFDAVYFYTTRELDMDDEQKAALLSFVHDDGKGFIGGHSATDTFYNWPEYGEMVGGYFNDHPWHQQVRLNVEDRTFPATRHFGPSITLNDEIYQLKDFSRDKVHVLLTLDTSTVDMTSSRVHRADGDFALAWVRNYGKGRVFSSPLGHEQQIYDRPDMRTMYIEAVKWVMGLTDGDATPRPRPAMGTK